jgi:hypothetical protein
MKSILLAAAFVAFAPGPALFANGLATSRAQVMKGARVG